MTCKIKNKKSNPLFPPSQDFNTTANAESWKLQKDHLLHFEIPESDAQSMCS